MSRKRRSLRRKVGMAGHVNVSGTLQAVVVKNTSVAVRGYVQAVRRLQEAISEGRARPDDVYIDIAQAANWLDSIASFEEFKGTIKGHQLVQGVLFARHRVHHQTASIAYFDDATQTWLWRPASQLPTSEDLKHAHAALERIYTEHLAQRPVVEAFKTIESTLTALRPTGGLY
jgi:hypothetical protein